MPQSEAQAARNYLGGLVRRNADPLLIEQARAELERAKARMVIEGLAGLSVDDRAHLALQLAGGDDHAG